MFKKTGAVRGLLQRSVRSRIERFLPREVTINGPQPWDPQILDERFYEAVLLRGTLGLGDSYMKGWWDCVKPESLDIFFEHTVRADLLEIFRHHPTMLWMKTKELLTNPQSRTRAGKVIDVHYDPGSDVILSFLDPYNQYTCGYWEGCTDLSTAQKKKLDLICRKLKLKAGDRVLDIGCGWCGAAKYMAERYDCRVTAITIAKEQITYGREFCRGLPVTIKLCDYRDLEGQYDKILICGMSEHVGYKNYRRLAECVDRCLAPGGLFLWHTIGKGCEQIPIGEPWLLTRIFPNGMVPTPERIVRATQGLFDLVDVHEFGHYYDPTLMAWRENFVANWPRVGQGKSQSEYRMWYYYLSVYPALFRVRKLNLWQFVFRKAGGPSYESVR